MKHIRDDKGYNQIFSPSKALAVRTERRCEYMIRKMNIKKNTKILEIGCGSGEISFLLAKKTNAEISGTDICKPFIDEAKKKYQLPNLNFEVMDFISPESVMDKKFDYIVGNGVLHHLYFHLDNALKNIFSLLNEKGKMIFLEPNLLNPYCFAIFTFPYFRKLANLEPSEMAFTKKFITQKLKASAYSQIKVEYRDFLLPNIPKILIKPVIAAGSLLERIPILRNASQSIFISAEK